jgi:hypothetical protein
MENMANRFRGGSDHAATGTQFLAGEMLEKSASCMPAPAFD